MKVLEKGEEIIAAHDEQVDFWLSGDERIATKLGVLSFVAEYNERFLVGNTITEGTVLT